MFFRLTFQIAGVYKSSDSLSRRNVLDLIDVESGQSLLAVYTTEEFNLEYHYNGVGVSSYGPALVSTFAVTYTTVTMTVTTGGLSLTASGSPGWTNFAPVYAVVNPAGRSYKLYLSNPTSGSASGTIQSIFISRK
jgi:hypothetical protein